MNGKIFPTGVFLLVALCAGGTFGAAAPTATVGTRAMLTYPFSDPDPVPCIGSKRYPYNRFDGSTAHGATQHWQTVTLANDRIRVVLTPEIGGKVWGATHLATGTDFIYDNHVVKFRDIASRGPWTSGGIEFNFGIVGHAPSCSTPVDWFVATNADGSVSCFVASEEYITRARWQVEVRLRAGAEEFETHTVWYNASGLPQPYYHWMNAAYSLRGNPRFLFPGTHYIGHGGDVHPWPCDERGRDLSIYSCNAFGDAKSEHILPGANAFYGIWWPEKQIGAYHLNEPSEKFGRKVWLWPLSRAGGIWEDLLTDTDGQYTELQSGRAFQQPSDGAERTPFVHPLFQPGATECFFEHWGVLHEPRPADEWQAGEAPVTLPLQSPTDFDRDSAYGRYLYGLHCFSDRNQSYASAEKAFLGALAKDAWCRPAIAALAALELRRGAYTAAHALARRLLALDAYDPEANYCDGFAYFAEGDNVTARARLGVAAFDPRYRAPAYARVARTYLSTGDRARAVTFAEKALAANAADLDALLVKALALRGTPAGASFARETLARYPLFHPMRYLVEGSACRRFVRNEWPAQTYLEWGSWFEESGLVDDARIWFDWAAVAHPIAAIRRAYLDRDKAALAAVATRPVDGIFPFRRESLPALRWAAETHPHWTLHYYLAVAAAAFDLKDEARKHFAALDAADSPVPFLVRARRRSGVARLEDLRRAERLGASWRVAHALCTYYKEQKDALAFLREAEKWRARYPTINAIQSDYAEALQLNGKNRECLAYLESVVFLPSELRGNVSTIWRRAQRALGLEVTYPENLGSGKPYPDSRAHAQE